MAFGNVSIYTLDLVCLLWDMGHGIPFENVVAHRLNGLLGIKARCVASLNILYNTTYYLVVLRNWCECI